MIQTVLFATSTESIQAVNRADTAAHYRRLLQVLGNGAEWSYRGECVDLGVARQRAKCACGQEGLRYVFTIHHKTGRTAKIGSTCIGHFHHVNADMVDGIQRDADRLEQEAADRLKAARKATQDAKAAKLLDDLNRAYWALETKIAAGNGRRVKWHIWSDGFRPNLAKWRLESCDTSARHPCLRVKQYKRVSALVKHLETRISTLNSYVANPWE